MSYLAGILLLYMHDDFLEMKIDSRSKVFAKLLRHNELKGGVNDTVGVLKKNEQFNFLCESAINSNVLINLFNFSG